MRHGSLFSGIGGFDLAAEWMGWENVFHCEINPFGQKILKHYWPKAISYEDITTTDFTVHRGQIDILTGGFPCQPFSLAGKRKGTEDDRNLWPEYYRAIKEIQPTWVVGENVPGIVNWSGGLVFEQVQADLENEGYEVWPVILPACGINAPHRRERVWFVAYADKCNDGRNSRKDEGKSREEWVSKRDEIREPVEPGEIFGTIADTDGLRHRGGSIRPKSNQPEERTMDSNTEKDRNGVRSEASGRSGVASDPSNERLEGSKNNRGIRKCRKEPYKQSSRFICANWSNFPTQSPICGGNDGISSRLDGITFPKWRNESIKAYGNAVVPPLVYQIFKAIQKFENKLKS